MVIEKAVVYNELSIDKFKAISRNALHPIFKISLC